MRKYLVLLFVVWTLTFVWAGNDVIETVVASDVKSVWLGSDEIVVAFGEKNFVLMPPDAKMIGDEVFMYVNAEGALVVFGAGLTRPNFDLGSIAESIAFRTVIRADGSLDMVPMVVIPGHAAVLYGTDSLENPDWHEIDPSVPMRNAGYHFFKFVLK